VDYDAKSASNPPYDWAAGLSHDGDFFPTIGPRVYPTTVIFFQRLGRAFIPRRWFFSNDWAAG